MFFRIEQWFILEKDFLSGISMGFISFHNIQIKYGKYTVIDDFSLDISKGEIVSIFGPSGSGKTTLFKTLLGLTDSSKGSIIIDGIPASEYKLPIAYVPQSNDLFPWLSVKKNIHLAYEESSKKSMSECLSPEESISLVKLRDAIDKYPKELSGGMAKRASLARGLSTNSDIFLFDESFVSVEKSLKDRLLRSIRDFIKTHNKTCLIISHDLSELTYMSDRVIHISSPPATVLGVIENELPSNRSDIDFNSQIFQNATSNLVVPKKGSLKDVYFENLEEERDRKLADLLGLTYSELSQADWEIDENSSEDGLVYNLLIRFDEATPVEILNKIKGLDDTNTVWLDPNALENN